MSHPNNPEISIPVFPLNTDRIDVFYFHILKNI